MYLKSGQTLHPAAYQALGFQNCGMSCKISFLAFEKASTLHRLDGMRRLIDQLIYILVVCFRCLDIGGGSHCLDTSPSAQFHACCLYWQHPSLPGATLFPRYRTTCSMPAVSTGSIPPCLLPPSSPGTVQPVPCLLSLLAASHPAWCHPLPQVQYNQFHASCLYWQHPALPGATLFPRYNQSLSSSLIPAISS